MTSLFIVKMYYSDWGGIMEWWDTYLTIDELLIYDQNCGDNPGFGEHIEQIISI